jgi:hypothetical protein
MFLGSIYGISDLFDESASTLVAYSNEDDDKEMFYYDERYELELKMKRFNGTHEIHEVVNRQGIKAQFYLVGKPLPRQMNHKQSFKSIIIQIRRMFLRRS